MVTALSVSALNVSVARADPSLQITNTGKIGILVVEINRDGEYWLELSGTNLDPGDVWSAPWLSNSGPSCTAQVRAFYEDRTTSKPVTINVCEEDQVEFGK